MTSHVIVRNKMWLNLHVFSFFAIAHTTFAATLEGSRTEAKDQAVHWFYYTAKNGKYSAMTSVGIPDFTLTLSCDPGYAPNVVYPQVICLGGVCPKPLPECVRECNLKKHQSLSYHCPNSWDRTRECDNAVLSGTTVITECKDRNYFSPHDLQCVNGEWDREAICKPECGRVTFDPASLTPIGDRPLYSSTPWHVTVYSKVTRSPVCGGTIISATVIISVAHCFWDSVVGLLPPTYRVVGGTLNQNSFISLAMYRQQRDVNEIKVPYQFDGTSKTVEYDIAVVTVTAPFQWTAFVTPACLDFESAFDQQQLSSNSLGKFASWDMATGELKPLNLPTLPAATCAGTNVGTNQRNITNNQICAGVPNGRGGGKTIAGTGLVFANSHHGVERFYLRGVASVASANGKPIVFNRIITHKEFISG